MPADPKPVRGPRRLRRVVDTDALRAARVAGDECVACRRPPSNVHHVLPRGRGGDDVRENLVLLCGSGTTGCHGAHHGSPYTYEAGRGSALIAPRGFPHVPSPASFVERRDAEWVNRRIGRHLAARRQDTITYVLGKLGDGPGQAWLERTYYVTLEEGRWIESAPTTPTSQTGSSSTTSRKS